MGERGGGKEEKRGEMDRGEEPEREREYTPPPSDSPI